MYDFVNYTSRNILLFHNLNICMPFIVFRSSKNITSDQIRADAKKKLSEKEEIMLISKINSLVLAAHKHSQGLKGFRDHTCTEIRQNFNQSGKIGLGTEKLA